MTLKESLQYFDRVLYGDTMCKESQNEDQLLKWTIRLDCAIPLGMKWEQSSTTYCTEGF